MTLSMWFSSTTVCGFVMPLVKAILVELEKRPRANGFDYILLPWCCLFLFNRVQNNPILQGGMSEDEIQYALAFLKTEYDKLGKFSIHEMVVGATIVLTLLIRTTTSYLFLVGKSSETVAKVCAPTIISVAVLCVAPRDLDFFKTFRNSVSSDAIFETFQRNHMMDEFEELLLLFKGVNSVWVVTTVILLCKVLTEFVSNSTLVYFLLRHVARVSVFLRIHPHFLMSSAVLAAALPFHTTLGTPANALVSTYVNIPHRKMLFAGSGLSLLAILVVWLTTALWSRVIWHDISAFPAWAKTYVVKYIDE
ncbi:unnamed protein product [Leptosia nina]|uniref:Uncharacterized protein n=1 Tax=Leptosia nina TaxID=320188 RepID=A0AAV1IXH2_9NEOP